MTIRSAVFRFICVGFVFSCSQLSTHPDLTPLTPSTAQTSFEMADSPEQWMSGDDQADYVNRATRTPSARPILKYKTNGDCDGFPKIDVKTAPGFCVGLVYDGTGVLKKSRWVAPLEKNKVLLVDMGGWARFGGKIYILDFSKKPAQLKLLLQPSMIAAGKPERGILDEPNQILKYKDKYYVGGMSGLYRFDPLASRPESTIEVLISGIPSVGLHPLKSFTFDESGGLYINVGSASNVCQNFTKFGDSDPTRNPRNFKRQQFSSCPEGENTEIGQAQVRRYQVLADGKISSDYKVFSKGLRNSIGLLWDPYRKAILQTENGRDAIGKFAPTIVTADFPHEEINVLKEGAHYGWPYCYDNNVMSPEWQNINCEGYAKPQALLPPHSAPLGMILHSGNGWTPWYKGRLLVALHGYEKKGHRIVAMKRDDAGLPTGVPQSLVYGWDARGEQGVGKPVSLLEQEDGSVLIVEDDDQNKVLRLFYDPSQGDGKPVQEVENAQAPEKDSSEPTEETLKKRLDDKIRGGNLPPFTQFQIKVLDKYCVECHQPAGSPGVRFIKYDDDGNAQRIRASGKREEILEIFKGNPNFIPMPPQGWESPAEQAEAVRMYEEWMKSSP